MGQLLDQSRALDESKGNAIPEKDQHGRKTPVAEEEQGDGNTSYGKNGLGFHHP